MFYVIWQLLELAFLAVVLLLWMAWTGLRWMVWMLAEGVAMAWDWWHARHPR